MRGKKRAIRSLRKQVCLITAYIQIYWISPVILIWCHYVNFTLAIIKTYHLVLIVVRWMTQEIKLHIFSTQINSCQVLQIPTTSKPLKNDQTRFAVFSTFMVFLKVFCVMNLYESRCHRSDQMICFVIR